MTGPDARRDGIVVADAMVSHPKRLALAATVGDVRRRFHDGHVHAALIVTQANCLAAIVELAPSTLAATWCLANCGWTCLLR